MPVPLNPETEPTIRVDFFSEKIREIIEKRSESVDFTKFLPWEEKLCNMLHLFS